MKSASVEPSPWSILSNITHHVAGFLLGAILQKSIEMGALEMVLVAFLCGKLVDIFP